MADYYQAIPNTLKHEGDGFVQEDHGRGPCKWGITLQTYKEFFPQATEETIRNLTRIQATTFYRVAFWDRYHLGRIADQHLANKVFDVGVMSGGGTSIQLLQRVAGVEDDGILGDRTAQKVNALDPLTLLPLFQKQVEWYWEQVVLAHPDRAEDLPAWKERLRS